MAQSPEAAGKFHAGRADRRMEIDGELKLKVHLQDWVDERNEVLLSIEAYRGRCNAAKTEMYQLMGFYSVFQGVVFSAVASQNRLTCSTSSIPAFLSILTTIAINITVHSKLDYYKTQELKLLKVEHLADNIDKRIFMLKQAGLAFDFAKIKDFKDEREKGKEETKAHTQLYWSLTFFLWVFFSVIFSSCFIILCWE